jgi:uncharacterized protein (AIM24 family)
VTVARVVRFPTDEVDALDEQFLYHLNRGAEHLTRGEAEEARAALARAAEMRPRDVKVLGLLGQACYRLGRFGDAAEAYGRLVEESPTEAGAQVNVGLALLKARRAAEATVHLERALDLNPEHRRAMGYLGLAWLEQGNVARAREWFERGGRAQMVERCDALLRGERPERARPEPERLRAAEWKVGSAPALADRRSDEEVERELSEALRILEQGARAAAGFAANATVTPVPVPLPIAPPPATLTPAPASAATAPAPPPPVTAARPLAGGLAAPVPTSAKDVPASIAPQGPARPDSAPVADLEGVPLLAEPHATFTAGQAVVQVAVGGEVLVRLGGLLAVEGAVDLAPEPKRLRGRSVHESFGSGRAAMQRARGKGVLLYAADGRRFTALELGGAAVHFREDAVFGFEGSLGFENGRLASPGAPEVELVRLAGGGAVLVATRGELVAVEVTPDRPIRVAAASFVGWAGALTPRLLPLARPHADADAVELSGEGRVLLDPGAALA